MMFSLLHPETRHGGVAFCLGGWVAGQPITVCSGAFRHRENTEGSVVTPSGSQARLQRPGELL